MNVVFPHDVPGPDAPAMSNAAHIRARLATRFDLVSTPVLLPQRSFTLWHPRQSDALLDLSAFEADGRIPYWAHVWPAARRLAAQLLDETGQGRTLLELGCGSGLGALAALAAGFQVTASDYYAEALEFVQLSALENHLPLPETRVIDWRHWPDDLGRFDVVVAADVLYEPEHADLVTQAITRSLAPAGRAWVADPHRLGAERFPSVVARSGLRIESLSTSLVDDGLNRMTVDLYALGWA